MQRRHDGIQHLVDAFRQELGESIELLNGDTLGQVAAGGCVDHALERGLRFPFHGHVVPFHHVADLVPLVVEDRAGLVRKDKGARSDGALAHGARPQRTEDVANGIGMFMVPMDRASDDLIGVEAGEIDTEIVFQGLQCAMGGRIQEYHDVVRVGDHDVGAGVLEGHLQSGHHLIRVPLLRDLRLDLFDHAVEGAAQLPDLVLSCHVHPSGELAGPDPVGHGLEVGHGHEHLVADQPEEHGDHQCRDDEHAEVE